MTALWRVTRAVLKWINNLPELVLGRWFWIPFFGFLLAGLMPVMLIALNAVGVQLTVWMDRGPDVHDRSVGHQRSDSANQACGC